MKLLEVKIKFLSLQISALLSPSASSKDPALLSINSRSSTLIFWLKLFCAWQTFARCCFWLLMNGTRQSWGVYRLLFGGSFMLRFLAVVSLEWVENFCVSSPNCGHLETRDSCWRIVNMVQKIELLIKQLDRTERSLTNWQKKFSTWRSENKVEIKRRLKLPLAEFVLAAKLKSPMETLKLRDRYRLALINCSVHLNGKAHLNAI